jgi:hypothetical protein
LYRGGNKKHTGTEIDGQMTRGEIIAAVEKGIDEKMTRLVRTGKLTEAQAASKGKQEKERAKKVVDRSLRAGAATKKAPAKRTGPVKAAKKAVPAKRTADNRQAAREAAAAAS